MDHEPFEVSRDRIKYGDSSWTGFNMNHTEKVKLIAEVLKSRFPNLTVNDIIDLAHKILEKIGD